jgi:hypothetical protein
MKRAAPSIGLNRLLQQNLPKAEIHILEAGHFALDEATDEIASLVRNFLELGQEQRLAAGKACGTQRRLGRVMGRLLSVNVGLPQDVTWPGKTVYTSIWKALVTGSRMVRRLKSLKYRN